VRNEPQPSPLEEELLDELRSSVVQPQPDLFKIHLKAALVARYAAGRGGHHSAGKVGQRRSQRDGTREWNRDHPDNTLNLRQKTGSPAGFPLEPTRKNHKQQVAAYNKKESK
jgi:hypothetical protein